MTVEQVIVSATDGPLPQTVDRLRALAAQGATSVDVVITRTDQVDDAELLELVELEIRDLAAEHGLVVASVTRQASDVSGSSSGPPYGPPYGPPS